MPILGLGAVVFFAPSARAQESDPQIFDNYEAAAAPVKAKSQPKATKAVSAQATTRTKETTKVTLQPASHRQSQTAQPSTVAAPSMRNSRRRDSDRP